MPRREIAGKASSSAPARRTRRARDAASATRSTRAEAVPSERSTGNWRLGGVAAFALFVAGWWLVAKLVPSEYCGECATTSDCAAGLECKWGACRRRDETPVNGMVPACPRTVKQTPNRPW